MNGASMAEPAPHRPTLGEMIRGLLKWLRAWQHSTMARRVAFLLSLIDNPRKERRFQRRVTLLRWGLIAGPRGRPLSRWEMRWGGETLKKSL